MGHQPKDHPEEEVGDLSVTMVVDVVVDTAGEVDMAEEGEEGGQGRIDRESHKMWHASPGAQQIC